MGQIRIIAGQWRGRLLKVPEATGLRPTPNRVRETLFNWLMPYLPQARCLDLYAGTGALGFEAASRGAQSVLMIDSAAASIQHLNAARALLNATEVSVRNARIPQSKLRFDQAFDIVFLDPPFHKQCLAHALTWLVNARAITAGSLIYVEVEKQFALQTWLEAPFASSPLPQIQSFSLSMLKHGQAGLVQFALLKVQDAANTAGA